MRSATCGVVVVLAAMSITPATADECWRANNVHGYGAWAPSDFSFVEDKFSNPMLICLSEKGGRVSGDNVDLVRLGASTLVGFASNGKGLELLETYQIDRQHMKLLFTLCRVGTETVAPASMNKAASYVGDLTSIAN